jgi:hypothetical protein
MSEPIAAAACSPSFQMPPPVQIGRCRMVNTGDAVPLSHLPVRTPQVSEFFHPKSKGNVFVVILAGEVPRNASAEDIDQIAVDMLYANGWTHPEHTPSVKAPREG